jgi:hypothetical protein
MKKLAILMTLLLAACGARDEKGTVVVKTEINKCLQREIFESCLQKVPQGPSTTATSNDWDEVIVECRISAARMADREVQNIPKECR